MVKIRRVNLPKFLIGRRKKGKEGPIPRINKELTFFPGPQEP